MSEVMEGKLPDLREVLTRPTLTIHQAIAKMEVVQSLLTEPEYDLGHVTAFIRGYKEVTLDVRDRMMGKHGEEKTFKEQKTIEQATINFAEFFFDPLHKFLTTESEKVAVWQPLFEDPRARKASPAIQFALGMDAHIKRDLPDMLSKLLKNEEEAAAYLDDFFNVDDLLDGTAHALSPEYVPLPHGLRRLVVNGTMRYIKRWRAEAWDNYVLLRECNGNLQARAELLSEFDKEALKTSEFLLTYGQGAFGLLEIPHHVGRRLTQLAFNGS